MKHLIKAEWHRLCYRFDPAGVVITGSVLTILCGIFMQMFTPEETSLREIPNIVVNALQCGGYVILIFVILMEACVVGDYIRNKLVNHELIMGYSFEQIWAAKQLLAGGMIAVVFCGTAWIGIAVEMLVRNTACVNGLCYRMCLLLLVLFRVSFVAMLYLYVVRDPLLSIGSFLLVQMIVIPHMADRLADVRIGRIAVPNLMAPNQIALIWSDHPPKHILILVIAGMAVEMSAAYVLARLYLAKKGSNIYV